MQRLMICLALMLAAVCAFAHDPSITGMKVLLDRDSAILSVVTHLNNFKNKDLDADFVRELHLVINEKPWTCDHPTLVKDQPNDTVTLQATIREPVHSFEVTARPFADNPNSKTIVTIMRDGQSVGEGVLSSEFQSWKYGQVASPQKRSVFLDFLTMGIQHILSGPDHLLFIFGLMLARPRIKELLKVATAFTIAHSITLSLCALNIFSLPSRIVEPLIALSIVAVAAEKFLKPNDQVWRTVVIAFFFGLIHGFGFAGALTEAGLPAGQAAVALASFNIGVEFVQAGLILFTIPILTWASAKIPKAYGPATTVSAVLISLAGGFWFIERIVRGG